MQINPKKVIEREIIYNINNPEKQIQQVGIDLTLSEEIILAPGEFINVLVNEKFDMQDTFGIINIRSSLSRKGIFSTSGIYDPGFKGMGGVSIYNLGCGSIAFEKGFRIAQMVVFKADAANQYNGVYNTKETVESQYAN